MSSEENSAANKLLFQIISLSFYDQVSHRCLTHISWVLNTLTKQTHVAFSKIMRRNGINKN